MAVRFKKQGPRLPHFIGAWRRFRGFNQETLADRLGTTAATLSRIEAGKQPYGQDFLEACAEVLECGVDDLLVRNPEDPEGIWATWRKLAPPQKRMGLTILRAIANEPTNE